MSDRGDRDKLQENLFDLPLRPAGDAVGAEPVADEPPEARRVVADAAPRRDRPRETPERATDESPGSAPAVRFGEQPATRIAPLLPRILAAGADLLVHLGALAVAALGLNLMGHEPRVDDLPPLLVLLLAFSFLYTVISLAFWGQTAGMAWFGLASRQSPQFPLSFRQATTRWVGGLITFALVGLPLLLALRGGSLTDRISGSQTYRGFAAGQ